MTLTAKILLILLILGMGFSGFYFISIKNSFLAITNDIFSRDLAGENLALKLENESLKDQLETQAPEEFLKVKGLEYQAAAVYSTYPFNNQRLISIALGSEDGIALLMPVAVSPGVLFGQVIEVFPKYSLVRTVFDPEFKTPVRIGRVAEDALLEGGNNPTISLVKKNRVIVVGDAVYSAGMQFPYGMQIGKLGFVADSQDDYFQEATVELAYNFNEIKKVYVVTNYFSK